MKSSAIEAPLRLFYIDDSGNVSTGYIVYSWIECSTVNWRNGLQQWLELRKDLYANHRIPPSYELHASDFINGRGYPSTDRHWNRSSRNRRIVAEDILRTLGGIAQLRVGTIYRRTTSTGSAYATERNRVYGQLIQHLDQRLARDRELGMVFVDGDGSATGYYGAHRALDLACRHVIEDPLFQASHRSQWVQMADLAAYSAYQGLLRHPHKAFAWNWYAKYLNMRDVNAGPLET
jgi:hypothetical protein